MNTRISSLPSGTLGDSDSIPFDGTNGTKRMLGSVINDKADKVASATSGNLASLDADGNLVDSGYATNNILGLSYTVVSTWT